MRPASSRVVTLRIAVLCFLTALSGLEGLASAQGTAGSTRKLLQTSLSLAPAESNVIFARAATPRVPPPATTDTWTGGGGGSNIKWSDASNWNSGAITSGENILINLTTAATDVDTNFTIGTLTLSHVGDSATILNGVVLTVGGNISNAGTITLGSSGNVTELVLGANATLNGGGTVVMSNNASNYIFGAAATDTLTNQETISGAGHIGNGQLTLVNSGTINSNGSAGMTINANGGITNTGTIEATAGSTLLLLNMGPQDSDTGITNTGGTISATGSTLGVQSTAITGGTMTLTGASLLQMNNSAIEGGTLTNSATGTIEILANFNTLGGTINNSAGGTFKIDNGAELTLLAGTYGQLGTVQENSTGNITELQVGTSAGGQNVTLSGGSVVMSNNANNYIFGAAATDTLTNKETISGAGHIGNGQLTLVNSGTINSNGSAGMTINANGGITNTGTIEATAGSTLLLLNMGPQDSDTGITNTGGTISANGSKLGVQSTTITGGTVTLTGASTLQMNNSAIEGGTLTNSATGTIEILANFNTLGGTINNSAGGTFKIDNGAELTLLAGTYGQLGTVQENSTGNITELQVGTSAGGQNVTLSGGSVVMSNNASNYIFGAAATDTLTNQETISGAGHIGNGQLTLVNSGTINSNGSAGMTINANGGITNTGTIEATAGSTLLLLNMGPQDGDTGITNTGGKIVDNASTLQIQSTTITGGTVTLTGASLLQMNNSAIEGGTLTNSATGTIEILANFNTLGGTINNSAGGTFKIDNGAELTLLAGTYGQLGTVQENSTGNITELQVGTSAGGQNVTLSGGSVVMSNNANNYIFGAAATDTLTNQETISGAGHIGNGQLTLVNSGTINSNGSAGMTINANGGITNTGTIEATAGSTLLLLNMGPQDSDTGITNTGGKILDNGSKLGVQSTTITGGTVTLTGASTLQMNNSAIEGGTLTNSATGTIEILANFNTLGGTINNSAGGTFKIDNGAELR